MQFRRRRSKRWLLLIPLLLIILASIYLAYLRGRPQVGDVFPPEDAVAIPGAAPLQISFSQAMNAQSVAANLRTVPERSGAFAWQANQLTFTPDQSWPSGQTVSVTLTTGARSILGLPLRESSSWRFEVAPTLLAYLWPAGDPADIYVLDPRGAEIIQLTRSEFGVLDFSITADSLAIYFSAWNEQGGADLWRLDLITRSTELLLPCGGDLCNNIQVSPQGRLAYENTTLGQILFWELENEAGSLMGGGVRPSWSSAGLLAFYDALGQAHTFRDVESGEIWTFANQTGEPGTWDPRGAFFVATEILPGLSVADPPAGHLLRFQIATQFVTDLSRSSMTSPAETDTVEDTSPSFSPDGNWIAFARKYLDLDRWTPGRQLWLMTPEGAEAHPITEAPNHNHSAFAWHPNQDQIAYLRADQTNTTSPPEIWLVQVDGSNPIRLIIGGYSPQWIP